MRKNIKPGLTCKLISSAMAVIMAFSACFADELPEKRGVRGDGNGDHYEWGRYKVPNTERYIAGAGGMGAFGNWIEDEDGNDLTPIYTGLSILCSNSGSYVIYYGHDDYGILTKDLKEIRLDVAVIPYCLEFDGFYVLAGTYCSYLPYYREGSVYFDIEGNKIDNIDSFLADRGTTLEAAVLDNESTVREEPFYDTGLIKKNLFGERFTDKSLERGGNFYTVDKYYLTDADGNVLSKLCDEIKPITKGLYLVSDAVLSKNGERNGEYIYSVLSVKDESVKEVLPERKTPYRCVDLGKDLFMFPVGGSGEYYNINGERINDLSAVLKRNNADLGRSKWAEDAITASLDKGYIPPDISFNYRQNITRREFCELFMRHIEGKYYGTYFEKSYISPFSDVDDYYVSAANAVGIVQGTGGGKFEPDREITRQEAAVLLYKTAKFVNSGYDEKTQPKFSDDAEISDWAKETVYTVCAWENKKGERIMAGTGDNKFSPNEHFTREQAVAAFYRMYSGNPMLW